MNRKYILGVLLVITVAAAINAPQKEGDALSLTPHAVSVSSTSPSFKLKGDIQSGGSEAVLQIQPRESNDANFPTNLFAATQSNKISQQPLIQLQTVSMEVAEAPLAPPLPFRTLGWYDDNRGKVLFLQYGDKNLVVRQGDTIEDTYKVESLTLTLLTLRYLPLDQIQTLTISATQ